MRSSRPTASSAAASSEEPPPEPPVHRTVQPDPEPSHLVMRWILGYEQASDYDIRRELAARREAERRERLLAEEAARRARRPTTTTTTVRPDYVSVWEKLPEVDPHAAYGLKMTGRSSSRPRDFQILSEQDLRARYRTDADFVRRGTNAETRRGRRFLQLRLRDEEDCVRRCLMTERLSEVVMRVMLQQLDCNSAAAAQ